MRSNYTQIKIILTTHSYPTFTHFLIFFFIKPTPLLLISAFSSLAYQTHNTKTNKKRELFSLVLPPPLSLSFNNRRWIISYHIISLLITYYYSLHFPPISPIDTTKPTQPRHTIPLSSRIKKDKEIEESKGSVQVLIGFSSCFTPTVTTIFFLWVCRNTHLFC